MPVTARKLDASTINARRIVKELAEQLAKDSQALGLTYEQLVEDAIQETRAYRNERRRGRTGSLTPMF